jgi:hypothetical protein
VIEVELTEDEWLYAGTIGLRRQIQAITKKFAPAHGIEDDRNKYEGIGYNVMGASGEAVVAKWLGIPWDGGGLQIERRHDGDVGRLEVRTVLRHDYPLRLHDNDKPERVYVLVTGEGPRFVIQGYLKGANGQRPEWFHDRPPPVGKATGRPAYWVPQQNLNHDLELLKTRFLAHYNQTTGTRRTA